MERVRRERESDGFINYFKDKWNGVDQAQLDALPRDFQVALLYGSQEEAQEVYKIIRLREDFYNSTILGRAALELIGDMRSMIEYYNYAE